MSACCFGPKDKDEDRQILALADFTPPLQLLDITSFKVTCGVLQSIHRYFKLMRVINQFRINFNTRPIHDRKKEAKQLRIRREVAVLQQMHSRADYLIGQLPRD